MVEEVDCYLLKRKWGEGIGGLGGFRGVIFRFVWHLERGAGG